MKKILLLVFALVTAMGAWATDVTLTSASQIKGGTFYDGSGNIGTASAWYNKVITNSYIPFTLDFGNQTGVSKANGKFNVYGSKTLTITSPFKITGYTLTGTPTAACTVTPAGKSATNWTANTSGTVTVSGLDTYTTTIAFAGEADGNTECLINVTSLVITVANLTDASQISTSKYYMIYNISSARKGYMNINPSTGQVLLTNSIPNTDEGRLPYIVRFVSNTNAKSDGDAYQLKFYDGTYLPWQDNGHGNYVSTTMGYNGASNEGYLPTYYNDLGCFGFQVYKGGSSRDYYFHANSGAFTFWGSNASSAENSRYAIYEVDGTDLQDIDYTITLDGATTSKSSRKLLTYKNSNVAVPTKTAVENLFTYATSGYYNMSTTTASADGSAITIPCTANYPFTTTALVDGKIPADAPLYRMHLRAEADNKYARYSEGKIIYANKDAELGAADYFCFVGNAVNGFKVYNMGAGANVVMGADNPTTNAGIWMLGEGHPTHLWAVSPNSAQGFNLRQTTGNSPGTDAYLHDYNGKFSYWHSSSATSDAGSGLVIETANLGNITYNVLLEAGGDVEATATHNNAANRVLSVPSSATRPFCTYTYYADQDCTEELTALPFGTTTIYALCNFNPPFKVSTSYAEAVWYYTKMRTNKYAVYGDAPYDLTTTKSATANGMWAFLGDPYNGIQVINKGAGEGKYLQATETQPTMTTTATNWVLGNNGGNFTLYNADRGYINDDGNKGKMKYWNSSYGASDDGSTFRLEGVGFQVTYKVLLAANDAEAAATANETKYTGGDMTLNLPSSAARDFCTYTYYSDAAFTDEITETTYNGPLTVYAKPTWDGPFTISSDYENATWYYLQAHGNYPKWISTDGSSTVASSDNSLTDEFQWAFWGNPYDGIKLINKACGDDESPQYITGTDPATMTGTSTVWTIKKQTNNYTGNPDNSFGIYDATLKYLNQQSETLKYWTDFDAGSTFWVTEVPEHLKSLVVSNIKPWFDAIGQYFSLDNNMENLTYANNTYAPALESCDLDTYNNLLDYVTDASHYKYPATGYYRLRNYRYDTSYMGLESNLAQFVNGGSKASTVVYLTKNPSNNTYTIQLQGKYVQTPTGSAQVTMGDDAVWFTPTVDAPGIFSLNAGGGNRGNLHNDGYQKIVGWDATGRANNNASYWYIEKATTLPLTLNDGGDGYYYATLCLPFDVTLNAAAAYTLTMNSSKTGLTLSEAMSEISAGTPVFIRHNKGTLTATIGTGYATTPDDNTSLTGCYTNTSVSTETEYTLGKEDDKVGFYKYTGTSIAANRAYVSSSVVDEVSARGFALDFGELTGISNVESQKESNIIYDMQGRRVQKAGKGLYIVNGKKVLY